MSVSSNREYGYEPLWGEEGASECTADGGGSLTANLTVGKKGSKYRAYGYTFHHEQDASREGVCDMVAARGDTAEEALRKWRVAAIRRGWQSQGVEAVYSDAIDAAAEAED